MASRALPSTAIALADLLGCTDAPAVYALFRRLRYPVEPHPISVPLDTGDLPTTLREGVAARYPLARIGGARPGDPSLDVTLFVLHDGDQQSRLVRGISQMWTRRFPGWHLLIFAAAPRPGADGFDRLTFVNTHRLGAGAQVRVKLHKLIVERRHPTRHDLDTLNRIALPATTPAAGDAYKAQCAAFDVERITNDFYRGYSRLFHAVLKRIEAENPNVRAPSGQPWQRLFTQRLFGRLMFLYFLQKKGALNGNPRFVADWYERAEREGRGFYLEILTPLFFDTLNRQRPDHSSPIFGRVPYLNGGLFAPDTDLPALVNVPNEIFDTRSPDGLLYFLNTHNFTVEEDTPLEVEVALDPEMLGKVFENLLEAEERGQSGTFYTPRAVVAFMCREALAAYLARATTIDPDRLGWLLDEAETGEPARDDAGDARLTFSTLPRALSEAIERALLAVRVLDPAVGSGAFPLGMLALLVGVRRALYRIAGAPIDPASHLVEGWKRNFIRDCLYGVDIKPEAIAIARLRLWLSLLVDAADPFKMEPLPNLDYKLMAGDSLIETFDGVEIYPTRPAAPAAGAAQATLLDTSAARALITQLHKLQDAYFQLEPGADRAALKRDIQETEAAIVAETLRDREAAERTNFESVIQKLANLQGKAEPPALLAQRQRIEHSIARTDEARADLRAGKPLPFFLYRLHFPSVFRDNDGFDIVIANPPYVSIENMSAGYKEAVRDAYPQVAAGRADLYVYFYARALQLLREHGTLSFISSNKFFRAKYGENLRNLLVTSTSLLTVVDLGDAPVFDATLDPCLVIAANINPPTGHRYRSLAVSADMNLDELDEAVGAHSQALEQRLGIRPPTDLVEKLAQTGVPLGKYVEGQIFYGIKTGLNEAFVVDQITRDRLVAESGSSAEVLKPFLRGRDIGRYTASWAGYWMIYNYHGIDIKRYPAIEAYLLPYKSKLEGRATAQAWYELQQPQLAYTRALQGPKILYPEIAMMRRFALDREGYYANNKTFFIPTDDYYLLGILNSKCSWYWITEKCAPLGDPTNRGRLELRETFMRHLPVPTPTHEQHATVTQAAKKLAEFGVNDARSGEWEKEIDEVVYEMFRLNEDEIREVERRALLGAGKRGKAPAETVGAENDDTAERADAD